jgi:hypothetical protein
VAAQAWNPNTQAAQAGKSGIQGYSHHIGNLRAGWTPPTKKEHTAKKKKKKKKLKEGKGLVC